MEGKVRLRVLFLQGRIAAYFVDDYRLVEKELLLVQKREESWRTGEEASTAETCRGSTP
jgi:hypothetical protein